MLRSSLALLHPRHSGGNGGLLPAPYGAYPPYLHQQNGHGATAAAAAAVTAASAALNTNAARGVPASAYYPHHPIIYWPYPSPPVSPTTYYAHLTENQVKQLLI